jgi:hypothetical protein
MKHEKLKIKNEKTGQIIELLDTNDIKILENQLVLLGMNGLFYSPITKDIRDKIDKLKSKGNLK